MIRPKLHTHIILLIFVTISLTSCDENTTHRAQPDIITSTYTQLNKETCILQSTDIERKDYKCKGVQGTDLFISESDGRTFIRVGNKDTYHSISTLSFSSIATPATAEWRIRNDKPFALIIRIFYQHTEDEERSNLGIFTISTEEKKGCAIGWVPANAKPSQNIAARQIADQYADQPKPCDTTVRHLHTLIQPPKATR